ncbi:MAG: hypothetical protein A6F71_09695 [Cycloclasticus sp. symbiont of Poecilosclerida sp. M]|nr:MAG: hypothetical protein A6F71_09695 [Cycloclasticus sp. symbiont of Poecilosclerida sp. M]
MKFLWSQAQVVHALSPHLLLRGRVKLIDISIMCYSHVDKEIPSKVVTPRVKFGMQLKIAPGDQSIPPQ